MLTSEFSDFTSDFSQVIITINFSQFYAAIFKIVFSSFQ